ncbi:kinetochore-associated Ndc80 complex subunit spc25 [Podochytrium sp. JEL0797]|nr:kinetochore-associated Ndc80 complex subunit spc25 [Podochytrium sp. JEL0797]
MDTLLRLDQLAGLFEEMGKDHSDFVNAVDVWVADKQARAKEERARHEEAVGRNEEHAAQMTRQGTALSAATQTLSASDALCAADEDAAAAANAKLVEKRTTLQNEQAALLAEVAAKRLAAKERETILKTKQRNRNNNTAKTADHMRFYQDKLAMTIASIKKDTLKFTFTNINNKRWEEEYSFVLDVTGTEYKLLDCTPSGAIDTIDQMLAFLNESRDFYRFLKEMRRGFLEYSTSSSA